ncbi:MAG: mechanosensitive ion channel family protein [Steroidobacteraceae bacterium]
MQNLTAWIEQIVLGNSLRDWGLALLVFGATFLVVPFVRGRIRVREQRWNQAKHSPTLELLGLLVARTSRLVLLSAALYFAEHILTLPAAVDRIFEVIIVFGIAVQLALWTMTALRFLIGKHYARHGVDDAGSRASVGVLMFVGQVLICAVFALLALDNLGVNITALVAGMGVGGIAIALAVQTILGDLFGSMSIALDKPFVEGDSLRIDDIEGTVERIGIKSTRLRSVTGEQIILSNADVLKSRVRNLGRMPERRVLFRLQVDYENASEKVERIGGIVRGVVESRSGARFVHCLLMALTPHAMEFEVVYWVANETGVNYGEAVDAINRGIVKEFAAADIAFGYPTQRLLMKQAAATPSAFTS